MEHAGMNMSAGASPAPAGGHHMGAHGSYAGHAIPGCFFIIWSTYWVFSMYRVYHRNQLSKKVFRNRSYYTWPFKGGPLLEPLMKVVFPLIGTLIEQRLGHDSWVKLTKDDGKFDHDAILAWQHTMMYLAFGISGCVDLLGTKVKLPQGTEQAFLGLAFIAESALMGFHLNKEGYALDYTVHLLLVYLMLACAAACFLEMVHNQSIMAATFRALVVFVQGTWFCQIGHILFAHIPAWDVADMHGAMFVPVVFCVHILFAALGFLVVFLAMQWFYETGSVAGGAPGSPGARGEKSVQLRDIRLSTLEELDDAVAEARVLIAKEYRD